MDRYGASTRDFDSVDGLNYDSPLRGGERSARGRRSDVSYDDNPEVEQIMRDFREQRLRAEARRPNRHLAADDSEDESECYNPEVERIMRDVREQRSRRAANSGRSHLDSDGDDSGDDSEQELRAARLRRGAQISRRLNLGSDGDDSKDDSELESRAARVRRGAQASRRSDLRLNVDDSENDSDSAYPRSPAGYGRGGMRTIATSYVDHDGPIHAGSIGDASETEQQILRRLDARRPPLSRHARELLAEEENYDSEI